MPNRLALFLALSVGAFFVASCRNTNPVEFVPTALSASWPKFTSAEEGIEIKYPADWHLNQSPGVLSFSGGSVNVGIQRLDEATRKQMEVLNHSSNWFPPRSKKVKIGDLLGEQSTGVVGFFDNVGNMEIETVTIMRGSFTYVINWSLGRGMSKAPSSFTSVCEEMVGTFRFIDVKHSDYLSYVDPMGGFTFEYPFNWILNTGGENGSINLLNGSPLLIRVDVRPHTTFEDFLHQQGDQVTHIEEKKEHFRHHLMGRRCRWLDRETYAFENQDKIYLVTIKEAPELGTISRKNIDDFLDSLTL
jgi:hypothetical protein